MSQYKDVPAPLFETDEAFRVCDKSDMAILCFPDVENFLQLIDEDNREKFLSRAGLPGFPMGIEINLQTRANPLELFDVYVALHDRGYLVICLPENPRHQRLALEVQELRKALAEADFAQVERRQQYLQGLNHASTVHRQNQRLATLGQIAASIAHEMRNPLTSIRGLMQLLQPDLERLGKADYSKIILDEILRMNLIITEFLQSAKPSPPKKEELCIEQFFDEIYLLCRSEASLRHVEIRRGKNANNLSIHVDKSQLRQIFLNIIQNAYESIHSIDKTNGYIQFTAQQIGDMVRISVRDNGCGIDDGIRKHIFDPFYTTKDEGTGLGLAFCLHIMQLHDGTISVDSALGYGSTFHLWFPMSEANVENLPS